MCSHEHDPVFATQSQSKGCLAWGSWEDVEVPVKEGILHPFSKICSGESPKGPTTVTKSQVPQNPGCGAGSLSPRHMDKPQHVASRSTSSGIWVKIALRFLIITELSPFSESQSYPLKWGHQLLP